MLVDPGLVGLVIALLVLSFGWIGYDLSRHVLMIYLARRRWNVQITNTTHWIDSYKPRITATKGEYEKVSVFKAFVIQKVLNLVGERVAKKALRREPELQLDPTPTSLFE